MALLLEYGAEVNTAATSGWANGWTPLHMAVRHAHARSVEIAEMLLARGANIDANDERGWTPLHLVVNFGHLLLAEYLLAHHAKVNSKDNLGHTPLSLASIAGRERLMTLLLKHGGEV